MIKKLVKSAGQGIKKLARVNGQQEESVMAERDKKAVNEQEEEIVMADDDALHPQKSRQSPADGPKETEEAGRKKSRVKWTLDEFQVAPEPGKSRFHDFNLPLEIMHGIADQGFEYCTPIQAKALPEVLLGRDLVGKAQTGTGKSAVFLITIFARLLAQKGEQGRRARGPRALVIAPTRELVMQITKDGRGLGSYCGLQILAVYGGANYQSQMDELRKRRVDVLVATPGRLLDFVGKNVVSLGECRIMVIDEADRMLDMGFIPDVRRIIGRLPDKEKRQTLLFSATVSDDVQRLASQWCVKPGYVEVEPEQVAVDTVEQIVYLVTAEEKYTVLFNLLKKHEDERIMVFANMKSEVKKLSDRLQRSGLDFVVLSGDVPQKKRESRLEQFRQGKVKVLVATDVAGRGIHIEGITYVINFTLPYEPEDYVHRIGRTGRAGAAGTSVSFACEEGAFYLPEIEEYIGHKLECVPPEEELLVKPPEASVQRRAKPNKRRRRPRQRRGKAPAAAGSGKKKQE